MRILILSTSEGNFATRAIYQAGQDRGHRMTILDPSQLSLMVSNIPAGYDRVYLNSKSSVSRIHIKDFDAIIPRVGQYVEYASHIIEHLSQNLDIFSTQSAEGILNASNKLRTLQLCSENGIQTPKSIGINANSNIGSLIDRIGGFPIVVKLVHGSGGKTVALINDKTSAVSTVQTILNSKQSVLIQQYIHSGGKDYRAIVIGNKVIASYQRSSASRTEFRANLQLGGFGVPVILSDDDKKICIASARAVGLMVAGVDFIKDRSKKSYLIEVNSNFGFKVQDITGVDVASRLIEYVERNYQKRTKGKITTLSIQQENQWLKQRWDQIFQDPGINSIYRQVHGRTVAYIDRKGDKRTCQINKSDDFLNVMIQTFQIKTEK
jgi:ribosomal protein S6--L-glutamate ligase